MWKATDTNLRIGDVTVEIPRQVVNSLADSSFWHTVQAEMGPLASSVIEFGFHLIPDEHVQSAGCLAMDRIPLSGEGSVREHHPYLQEETRVNEHGWDGILNAMIQDLADSRTLSVSEDATSTYVVFGTGGVDGWCSPRWLNQRSNARGIFCDVSRFAKSAADVTYRAARGGVEPALPGLARRCAAVSREPCESCGCL
eukprot:2926544-Rhodomonas_salina.2